MFRFSLRACFLVLALSHAVACDFDLPDAVDLPPRRASAPDLEPDVDTDVDTDVDPAKDGSPPPDGAGPSGSKVAASTRANLQWKRADAFEADLAQALDLPKSELCNEFGIANCIHDVHLGPLGGHDPFESGALESTAEPLATTPLVVDRIVLSACNARLNLEAAGGVAESAFAGIELSAPSPAPEAKESHALVNGLYRRFLGRDADPQDLAQVTQLAVSSEGSAVSGREFALSACYVVGTSTEFLFF